MSFVTIVASSQKISVVSDGRAVHTDMEGRETYYDDYPKFKEPNPKSFFAYTGTKEVCEHIYSSHKELYSGDFSLEHIANVFYENLKPYVQQGYNGSMTIGGFEQGTAKMYYFNSTQVQTDKGVAIKIPNGRNPVELIYMGGDNVPKTESEALRKKFFEKLSQSEPYDFKRYIFLQKELIKDFSKQDTKYINDNCLTLFLTN